MTKVITMILKTTSVICLGGVILFQFRQLDTIASPCSINLISPKPQPLPVDVKVVIEKKLRFVGARGEVVPKLAKAIKMASHETNINHSIIVALISTEDPDFKPYAKSKKGYKGFMQTPTATGEFYDVDVLHGTRILEQKLFETKGDLLKALALYKGGNNPEARREALQTYKVYQRIKNIG